MISESETKFRKNKNSSAQICVSIADVLQVLSALCLKSSNVCKHADWKHVDFISLDTELTEPNILISFPWQTVTVDYFLIETQTLDRYREDRQRRSFLSIFMPLVGYTYVATIGYPKAIDHLYARHDLIIE
jgi:hypothetical protein